MRSKISTIKSMMEFLTSKGGGTTLEDRDYPTLLMRAAKDEHLSVVGNIRVRDRVPALAIQP